MFAADAYQSAQVAFNSARAAGQDAQAAIDAANQAVKTATDKIDEEKSEQAVAQVAYCKANYPQGSDLYNGCIHLITASNDEKAQLADKNAQRCAVVYPNGSPAYRNCLHDVLSPSFEIDQELTVITGLVDFVSAIAYGLASITVGGVAATLCVASEICGLAVMAVSPEGGAFVPWMTMAGVGAESALTTSRIAAIFEDSLVDGEAADAVLADNSYNLFGRAPDSLGCLTGVRGHANRPAIALGINGVDGNPESLIEFSDRVNAPYFMNWLNESGISPNWWKTFLGYLGNGTTTVYFNLEGIDDVKAFAEIGKAEDAASGPSANWTAWELYRIQQRLLQEPGEFNTRIIFYRGATKEEINPFS